MINGSVEAVELATRFNVADYTRAEQSQDRDVIAGAIHRRFRERYIDPVSAKTAPRHGFTMMAVACLMIEALECFRLGWETSDRKSRKTFRQFFDRSGNFRDFQARADDFYDNVRCGILHQAETTAGWRVRRRGPLFDSATLTINATRFIEALRKELNDVHDELVAKPWDDPLWVNVRAKMHAIIKHCE